MRTTMQTTVVTCLLLGIAGSASADLPAGPDAINGAYTRLLEHSPAALTAAGAQGATTADEWVAAWVNAAARGDTDGAAAGFTQLLARRYEAPAPLPLAGEADPLATLVRESLQSQAAREVAYAAL